MHSANEDNIEVQAIPMARTKNELKKQLKEMNHDAAEERKKKRKEKYGKRR